MGTKRRTGRRQNAQGTAANRVWTSFMRTGQIVPALSDGTPAGVVWANSLYIVVMRTLQPLHEAAAGMPGTMVWLSIKGRTNGPDRNWRDFQRIKNELVGEEVEAVELYPAESRLVDCANQYHLWCFPGFRFPFGFAERRVADFGHSPETQ